MPKAVRIWKVGLRGRNKFTDRLYDWKIEENDTVDGNRDMLYVSPANPSESSVYIDYMYKEFLIDSVIKYKMFRLFCNRAESNRPDINTFQWFV